MFHFSPFGEIMFADTYNKFIYFVSYKKKMHIVVIFVDICRLGSVDILEVVSD